MGHDIMKGEDVDVTLRSPSRIPEGRKVRDVSTIGDNEIVIHDGHYADFKKVKKFYTPGRHFLIVVDPGVIDGD